MSRIGKQPIPVPSGAKVDLVGRALKVSGPKGTLEWTVPAPIEVAVEEGLVVVRRPNDQPTNRALHGMSRALIANMVKGVTDGYEVKLEVYGTGYGCKVEGGQLYLNVGYMGRGVGRPAQFMIDIPDGLQIEVETPTARGNTEPAKFAVRGADKQQVGQFAAEVRKIRKPEPYLGKGVRYAGEHIRRKAGKVFAGGGAG
ncbi:MAG: 50S ribosomal protein L6 [Planctomycetes bacterium]|nr:50S ribosomal protein L6 [Planctomycetota bacterium]